MDRERILSEFKRCAIENGGVPLGRERFEKRTGIYERHWSGKYWVRWSELVCDAGYEPNSMNAGYEADYLLGHLAVITLKLGHLPTVAELKFEKQTNLAFPSHNTFGKLGSKREQVQKLGEYCSDREGFAEVAAMCVLEVPTAVPEPNVGTPTTGWVYLVKSGHYFKIGHTNDIGRRKYELNLALPHKVEEVHRIETDDAPGIERYWHERFKDKRMNGEWFKLDKADVAAFKLSKGFM
ncbi:MAG: GIY-YIG nuclease family protein [Acidimicrobiaceae bacterium]|nr:GIY-YIG nuclease family protein [Acidimicrobiaceae bacterium]